MDNVGGEGDPSFTSSELAPDVAIVEDAVETSLVIDEEKIESNEGKT